MDKRKIVLIDDEKDFAKLVKMNLERTKLYKVTLAYDGDQGLKKIEKVDPDLILLDVNMPKMNGFEVLKELRQPGVKWRPVVMLTAKSDPEDILHGYDLKAEQYMTKPFDIQNLLRVIQKLISLTSS